MVCDGLGRPLTFFLSPDQTSDAKGALALLSVLPSAKLPLADKGDGRRLVPRGPCRQGDRDLHPREARAEVNRAGFPGNCTYEGALRR